jgi:hypothetical protein
MQTNTIDPLAAAKKQLQYPQATMKVNRSRSIFQGIASGRQFIYLSIALLVAVPNFAWSTDYDLRTDWTDGGLPMAGVWTIDFNGTPMIPVPNLDVTGADVFPGGQAGYATVENYEVPIWFQARDDAVNYFTNPSDADWFLGDIVFHDADAAPTSVNWRSPENSLADISISLWNPRNFGRTQYFELTLNGTVLGSGDVDDSSDRANRVSLSVNNVSISVGDIVAVTSTSVFIEDYMGLDFSIVTNLADVDIDIKPGSNPNGINPSKEGVIAVAILGSNDFDATQVIVTTIEFGPDSAAPVHDGHVEDVNNDGHPDFVVHFNTPDTGIACGDIDATLTGSAGEIAFMGTDSVKTSGCTVPQTVYFNDFDGGLAVALGVKDVLDGITTTESVQGYGGVGGFGGDFLRNDTGGDYGSGGGPIGTPGEPTRLTLTKLPRHSSVDINFLLAIIDWWDGSGPEGCPICHPDIFNVRVDGVLVFSESFGFHGPTFVPPPGVLLAVSPLGFDPGTDDAAYDMGLNPTFDNIPHTAKTLTIEWFADGAGWQGGIDESWAIDNLEIVLNE